MTASFSSESSCGSSMDTESSVSAMATVRKPSLLRSSMPFRGHTSLPSRYAHGIWNTVPMLTLIDRRYNGSLQSGVSSTASIFSAAADRKTAPTLVGFTTFSSTAILRASIQTSSAVLCAGLRMAHSIPRVSL